ncbi:hypothetical protein COHA_006113 [Chlorella ohadii]|uniref:Uncharacterized protein n=1 Tax=Chlorella ohadii TaxID=2649997 RepID=A0AAD5DQD3_9CHLO|nr:hypothetical protein COHA_006113 [Chlorella ohadii]
MQVSPTGTTYGLRFTAYFPCAAQGRYEVLDATVHQPGPTNAAAFGPRELNSLPPNSTDGIGWGADVGSSARVRLQADFTRVALYQATDIAVNPSDPSNIWVVGPVNDSVVNPACGQPYGGPLLKWNWGTTSFKPAAGINAAGVRVTVMPETHRPWIVDGCGQLRGWSSSMKSLYGPTPQGRAYDVAAVNSTVFSGCSFYDPSTFEGGIAAGCSLSVAVGPNGALYASPSGDVAVAAGPYELLAQGQDVLYKDPALGRYFRLYRAPENYQPVRIAAGTDGAVWLVLALSATGRQRAVRASLAGVYRGFAGRVGQAPPASWPQTCAEVDPGCTDGGCDAGLTRCVRCAFPKFVMGSDGKCRLLGCTDVDPNCAECGPGTMCTACDPGFVRGYHSGDTLCRRPINGSITCWNGALAEVNRQAVELSNSTWQHVSTSVIHSVFVDRSGNVLAVPNWDGKQLPPIRFATNGTWRAAAVGLGEDYLGITKASMLAHADGMGNIISPPVLTAFPNLAAMRVLTLTTERFDSTALCLVTTDGLGRCTGRFAGIDSVHAVCHAGDNGLINMVCFLGVYGDVHCVDLSNDGFPPEKTTASFTPPEGELWVEIACGSFTICARATSGKVRCFSLFGNPYPLHDTEQLPGGYLTIASFQDAMGYYQNRQRVCGIDTARQLQCLLAYKYLGLDHRTFVTLGPERPWAAVAITFDGLCAISAD